MKRQPDFDQLFYAIVAKLMAALDDGPTPLGELLQLHLMTEVILEELLRHAFAGNAKAVLEQELRYSQKLAICAKLQHPDGGAILGADLARSMKKLNELRDQVVHNVSHKVTAADVEALFVGELGRARSAARRHDDIHAQLSRYKAAMYVRLLKPRATAPASTALAPAAPTCAGNLATDGESSSALPSPVRSA